MIATRAPLRVSLGGGGTDLPSYYREHGGFVVSAAIDKHVWMLLSTRFQDRLRLKHLEWEEVDAPHEVRHPILRAALDQLWDGKPLELASLADVPAGTGLGSSGAYAACAVKALRLAAGADADALEVAEEACRIEIEVLDWTVGKQDQYAAAYGGVNALTFAPDGSVEVRPLQLPQASRSALRERFLLFFCGGNRSASQQLSHQVNRTLAGDTDVRDNLRRTEELARSVCTALEAGDLDGCGDLMNEQWEVKRGRSPAMVTDHIGNLREVALRSGAQGVMLMGAGGGGFLLALASRPDELRQAMAAASAPELQFDVDTEGCLALSPGT